MAKSGYSVIYDINIDLLNCGVAQRRILGSRLGSATTIPDSFVRWRNVHPANSFLSSNRGWIPQSIGSTASKQLGFLGHRYSFNCDPGVVFNLTAV